MCRWSLRRWSSRASKTIDIKADAAAAAAAVADDDSTTGDSTSSTRSMSSSCSDSDLSSQQQISSIGQFSLFLNIKFIAVTILLSTGAAFSVGCIARVAILSQFGVLNHQHDINDMSVQYFPAQIEVIDTTPKQLPSPTILPGKEVPYTTYASKTFQIEGSATSHTLHIDRRSHATKVTSSVNEDLVKITDAEEPLVQEGDEGPVNDYSHNDDSDGLHLPAGQHLLVDIKDVDSAFLNSEERLATAMVELISVSKLTLLSYHCHSLVPIGVSCAGVLLESHVAFHTWPEEGVITMDLFTCGGGLLIPVIPDIEKLFGVRRTPAEDEDEQDIPDPTMVWSHKLRGFREGFAPGYDADRNPLDSDLGRFVLGKMDLDVKEELVSEKTMFQQVDVYDVMYPNARSMESYHKSQSDDGSYEASNPEQFGPDRVLFLDGVIQSTLYGDAPYHESIVHPAMITHPNPKRVAIIGGGEGATLREVLKHSTVEEAAMIEIDEGVVSLSREHLPQWQDCSSIAHHDKSAEWCFDDERVNARFEDAMAYFIDNFSESHKQKEEAYDVIIMDALDPNDEIEFAVELYTSSTYIQSLYNALTSEGILVVQVGEAPKQNNVADESSKFANRAIMQQVLQQVGFESIHVYVEGHSGFMAPWTTLVAFKDIQTRKNWYRSPAEIELNLQKRILPTKSGDSSLRYFDGATMSSYQLPSAAFESVHCRQENTPSDCGKPSHGSADTYEIDSTVVYNPVVERHGRESMHSREFAVRNIHGWKKSLLN